MGIVLKSTIGLGTVYFLMFSPTAERPALGPAASLCAEAAAAHGSGSFAAQAQSARCLMALGVAAAPLRLTQAEDLSPPPPPPPRPAGRPGGLTDSDLAEPWFGPGGLSRKSPRRG